MHSPDEKDRAARRKCPDLKFSAPNLRSLRFGGDQEDMMKSHFERLHGKVLGWDYPSYDLLTV